MKDNATNVFAFARFSDLAESSTAVEELRNKKVEALNNSPIYLDIIIYSKDTKSLGRAQMAIDKNVKGDIIKSGDDVLWDRDFESPAGQEKLASFAIPRRCELIWDCALRRITLYGEQAARQTAKSSIMEYFRTIKSHRQVFPISSRERLASLLSGGLRPFVQGLGKTTFDWISLRKRLRSMAQRMKGWTWTVYSSPRLQVHAYNWRQKTVLATVQFAIANLRIQ